MGGVISVLRIFSKSRFFEAPSIMADLAELEAQKKRRQFKKYSYRGVDLEQLLDMKDDKLVELFNCRARRRYARGMKRKHNALLMKLRKAKKGAPPMEKPEVVKTHLRNMIIKPEMIGSIVGVYNGKTFNQLIFPGGSEARDDWLVSRRILHFLQAGQARSTRYRSHPQLPVHPPQVISLEEGV